MGGLDVLKLSLREGGCESSYRCRAYGTLWPAPALRPSVDPPAHQRLDLGEAAGDAVDLGFEPDDAFRLGRGELDLVLELADAGPDVRCGPGGDHGLGDDGENERQRHLLVEMPLALVVTFGRQHRHASCRPL